jgi:hypothetical protein
LAEIAIDELPRVGRDAGWNEVIRESGRPCGRRSFSLDATWIQSGTTVRPVHESTSDGRVTALVDVHPHDDRGTGPSNFLPAGWENLVRVSPRCSEAPSLACSIRRKGGARRIQIDDDGYGTASYASPAERRRVGHSNAIGVLGYPRRYGLER